MRVTTYAPTRCGMPVLLAATPSRIAPKRDHGVSMVTTPLNEVSRLATPKAQNSKQPIRPAAPYSITFVIQARIMKDAIAMACLAGVGMSNGENQIATGMTTQSTMKKRFNGSTAAALLARGSADAIS